MQTVFSEARAIVNVPPSTQGPYSLITLEGVFGRVKDLSELPSFRDRQFSPGQYISECGQVPDEIFVVVRGIAMLEAPETATGEYKARTLMPEEVIGLIEGLAGRPFKHSVVASTQCTVRTITLNDLILHLADHPDDRSRVIRLLADFVRHADRYLKSI